MLEQWISKSERPAIGTNEPFSLSGVQQIVCLLHVLTGDTIDRNQLFSPISCSSRISYPLGYLTSLLLVQVGKPQVLDSTIYRFFKRELQLLCVFWLRFLHIIPFQVGFYIVFVKVVLLCGAIVLSVLTFSYEVRRKFSGVLRVCVDLNFKDRNI